MWATRLERLLRHSVYWAQFTQVVSQRRCDCLWEQRNPRTHQFPADRGFWRSRPASAWLLSMQGTSRIKTLREMLRAPLIYE